MKLKAVAIRGVGLSRMGFFVLDLPDLVESDDYFYDQVGTLSAMGDLPLRRLWGDFVELWTVERVDDVKSYRRWVAPSVLTPRAMVFDPYEMNQIDVVLLPAPWGGGRPQCLY